MTEIYYKNIDIFIELTKKWYTNAFESLWKLVAST